MSGKVGVGRAVALALMLACGLAAQAAGQKEGKKGKKKESPPDGVPVLWREPADIESRDLFHGPGGEAAQPDLSRVTFLAKEEGGFSTKYRVRDAKGRVWVAKLGKEAQSETAATRLVWAAGYYVETTYLAPCVRIEGAPKPGKEIEQCQDGGLANVRFEARPEDVRRLDLWRWEENPFAGTREMQGLKVLMALVENWDTKDENNKVLYARGESGRGELRYVVSDLGATFGSSDGPSGPVSYFKKIKGSRNEPAVYARDEFVEKVEGNLVRLEFGGKNAGMMKNITVADARWIGGLLARLSDRQIADAFRAANYTDEETRLLAGAVGARIRELTGLGAGAAEKR